MGSAASAVTHFPTEQTGRHRPRPREKKTDLTQEACLIQPKQAPVPEASKARPILFEISQEEQIDFDDSQLKSYKSFEWPDEDKTPLQALPPGREEHERNLRRVKRLSRSARRYPRAFRVIVGRDSSSESEGEAP
ncbi:unnamed protein product [Durusdinium trenchii]|uniref:Uncharacterized protein n=1 Tax=Durusdinium trenchii TaxID=1381693 RepID=A0ABP0IM71_9DINO